jgi:cobalamin biosynthesis Mg chelatase CobN
VDYKSPFQRVKELDTHIRGLVSYLDIDTLPAVQREIVTLIKRQASDARLDLRDYGMAETKAEQDRLAKEAYSRLEELQKNIVKASEYGFFSAIDVAQFSANIQQIISDL